MTYKDLGKYPTNVFIGGLYEPIDKTVCFLESTLIRKIYAGQTTLIAENISGALKIDKSASGYIINLDPSGISDIDISTTSSTTGSALHIDSRGTCMLSANKLSEEKFPTTPTVLEEFLRDYPGFEEASADFDSTATAGNHLLIKTTSNNISHVYLRYDYGLGKWIMRYQTWRVKGYDYRVWGADSGPRATHLRMSVIGNNYKTTPIISTLRGTGPLYDILTRVYYNNAPADGIMGSFSDTSNAIKLYTTSTTSPPAIHPQIAADDSFAFVVESNYIRVLNLSPPTSTYAKLPPMPDLKNPVGLLVRHDPAYLREKTERIQFIIADAGAGTTPEPKLWLFSVNMEDPAKPEGKLEELPVKYSSGMPYPLKDFWDLTWVNEDRTAFYMPEPGKNKFTRISIAQDGKSATVEAEYDGIPTPRTVLVASRTQLYVICKNEIGEIRVDAKFDTDSYDVLGIGHIPFKIKAPPGGTPSEMAIINESTGLANTYQLKNWPIYVQDLPFGDAISLMINHTRLYGNGVRWYEVYFLGPVDPKTGKRAQYQVNNDFADLYNGRQRPTSVYNGRFYPVREDAIEWYYPHLGALIDTRTVLDGKSGIFELHVDFYSEDRDHYPGSKIGTDFKHSIQVDNRRPWVKLESPTVSDGITTQKIDSCGSLRYLADSDNLSFKYHMKLEGGGINYSIITRRGDTAVLKLSESKQLSSSTSEWSASLSASIKDVLETCPTALITIRASQVVNVTNGYSIYPHSASDQAFFALYKECKATP